MPSPRAGRPRARRRRAPRRREQVRPATWCLHKADGDRARPATRGVDVRSVAPLTLLSGWLVRGVGLHPGARVSRPVRAFSGGLGCDGPSHYCFWAAQVLFNTRQLYRASRGYRASYAVPRVPPRAAYDSTPLTPRASLAAHQPLAALRPLATSQGSCTMLLCQGQRLYLEPQPAHIRLLRARGWCPWQCTPPP